MTIQHYAMPADTAGAWQQADDAGLAGVVDKILRDARRIATAAGHVEQHAFCVLRKAIKLSIFNPGYGRAAVAAAEVEALICKRFPHFRRAAQIMRGAGINREIGRTEQGFAADKAATACLTMSRGRPIVDATATAAIQSLWKAQNWDSLFPGQFTIAKEKKESSPVNRGEICKALQRLTKAAEKRGLDDDGLLRQAMQAIQQIADTLAE